jgi:hypothetical protein
MTPLKDKLFDYLDSHGVTYEDATSRTQKKNRTTKISVFKPDLVELIDSLTPEDIESLLSALSKRKAKQLDTALLIHEYLKENEYKIRDLNGDETDSLRDAAIKTNNGRLTYNIYDRKGAIMKERGQSYLSKWDVNDPQSMEIAMSKLISEMISSLGDDYDYILRRNFQMTTWWLGDKLFDASVENMKDFINKIHPIKQRSAKLFLLINYDKLLFINKYLGMNMLS